MSFNKGASSNLPKETD